ncbi:hypothetical protein H8S11_13720 [Flintibacter sp. NSJ-23]|uniref:Uncharacterized protein n=1 Tax=Flintibacter hominis TaxID=2763048 RepID=A0A8J6JC69_9FIRM|nr:hypothetical protein [Flintibacter hominis]MBC5723853.1 hypothetical protein [Flintibacter hominis]
MSVQSEIDRIKKNVNDTLKTISDTGVTVGAGSDSLPAAAAALANEKQDKLTGTQGQVVGFDSGGNAVPQDAPQSGMTQEQADQRYLQLSGGTMTGELALQEFDAPDPVNEGTDPRIQLTADGDNLGLGKIPLIGLSPNYDAGFLFTNPDEIDASAGETGIVSKVDCGGVVFYNAGSARALANVVNDFYLPTMFDVKTEIRPKSTLVTLPLSAWSNNTQTVTVPGVLADESKQLIQPMPTIADQAVYSAAGISCTGQAANKLTFKAQTVPTEDVQVYVVIQEVGT